MDCIPCGMEYFPASNDNQWNYIKKLIDDCDYYIVIIAGKYGSIDDEENISYTQKEYEYAVSKGVPTIGFIHGNPDKITSGKTDNEPEKQAKLNSFKGKVQKKLCKFWTSKDELGGIVSRSMIQEIKRNPRTGWIKADSYDANAEKTMISLYKRVEELENELKRMAEKNPLFSRFIDNAQELSQGEDVVELVFHLIYSNKGFTSYDENFVLVTWNELTKKLFPKLILPIRESYFKTRVLDVITCPWSESMEQGDFLKATLTEDSYETIKIQFLALGYIEIFNDIFPVSDGNENKPIRKIRLTELGNKILINQRAIKRKI